MSHRGFVSGLVFALALMGGQGAHAQPTIEVRGDTACPSADMIRAALQDVGLDPAWLFDPVIVDVSAERLSLTLGHDQSAHREVPAAANCEARAESVALLIRAWSTDLPSHPTSAPLLKVALPASKPDPETVSDNVFELDGAVFYSAPWGHAPGFWLGVGRTPLDGGWGFRLFGAYQSARDIALAGGKNHLHRVFAGVAPTFHLQGEEVFASADLGLLVTSTQAQGAGYDITNSSRTWNLGAVVDLRGGVHLGRFRCWLNARLLRLLHAETITISSGDVEADDTSRLAAWDVQLGIGMGVRFE